MRGPLSQEEFDWIFSRVPRLTVEVVIATPRDGVLLQLRDIEPCKGMWSLPGGTVRFGEPLVDAVERVALDELDVHITAGQMLGYIEYPSHYNNGLDSPVGIAFIAHPRGRVDRPRNCEWFTALPERMHDEQRVFLTQRLSSVAGAPGACARPR